MTKISLWNHGQRGPDYTFIDRHISEFVNASGTGLYVYLYIGSYDENGDPTDPGTIQDVVFQENRDRRYSENIIEMRGCYNIQDNDFDLRQFGFFMGGDTIFMEVHLNDMIALCGRKIQAGDVLELPHQRDETGGNDDEAINRFYVVEDATRASNGYSATWRPHLWRIKLAPMTDSQEFADITERALLDPFGLTKDDKTLGDAISMACTELGVNIDTVKEAEKWVKERNFETTQFYFVEEEQTGDQLPWIWAGDGEPPNGAQLLASGISFPENAPEGSFFLKTNLTPHQLYKKVGSIWELREVDYRMGKWSATHRILDSFFNNCETTTFDDGTEICSKIALSQVLPPPEDF